MLHEQDACPGGLERHLSRKDVDGLLFKYKHFMGRTISWGRRTVVRHEVRVVRAVSSVKIVSRCPRVSHPEQRPLRVLRWTPPCTIQVVKPPQVMQDKRVQFNNSGTTTNGWKRTWLAQIVCLRGSHLVAAPVRGTPW